MLELEQLPAVTSWTQIIIALIAALQVVALALIARGHARRRRAARRRRRPPR